MAGHSLPIAGRRFGVIGLQRSGLATVQMLLAKGAWVIAADAKAPEQISPETRARLAQWEHESENRLHLRLGDQDSLDLAQCEVVILSPGVPCRLPALQPVREAGREVIGELELAYRLCPAPMLAITGTKGKSTATHLATTMLAGCGHPVIMAGNVGTPLVSLLEQITPKHRVVVEVSSFQLETIVRFRPEVAVLLNFFPDHLDRHESMQEYAEAKGSLFRNQTEQDRALINADLGFPPEITDRITAPVLRFSAGPGRLEVEAFVDEGWLFLRDGDRTIRLVRRSEVLLAGDHNVSNLLAAALAVWQWGAEPEAIREAARTFRGLPHRLEQVEEIAGIRFINDSQATIPEATAAALASIDDPVVLIAGGLAKVDDFEVMAHAARRAKAVVLIGRDARRLGAALETHGVASLEYAGSLEQAVERAASLAPSPGVVLFSPACASFDMFSSFEERGEVFRAAVHRLRR